MKKRALCLAVAAASLLSLCACEKKQETVVSDMEKGEVSYPIQTDEKLTYWCELPSSIATTVTNFGETQFAKNLTEATGIEVEYIHPSQGQSNALELLIASGEMPDIVASKWVYQSPESCISQKIVYQLDDLIKDYAPNFKKYIDANEEFKKQVVDDKGECYAFPFIRGDKVLCASGGIMLRSDWLSEAGLAVPETVEEWDAVLAAFKKKCDTPLALTTDGIAAFSGMFGAFRWNFLKDGKVSYGPAQPEFKDYMAKLHEWYEKGYLDKNYAIADSKIINSNILNGVSGVTYGSGGSGMGVYLSTNANKKFDLTAAPYPAAKKGEKARFAFGDTQVTVESAAITTACKNPALAARLLDYGYSEEGQLFYNFGKEGESYNREDGYPKYAANLLDTSDGKPVAEKLTLNCKASTVGPFVQDRRYIEQYYTYPQQLKAIEVWADHNYNFDTYRIPWLTLTTEENEEYGSIMGEIGTYASEMFNNVIVGKDSVDNFDKHVKKMYDMGLEKAMNIQQQAYERYINR